MICKDMRPFIVMDIVREASRFEDTVHYEIGQPDIPPSNRVKEALKRAIDEDRFSYTDSFGLRDLREKIAKNYKEQYKVDIDIDRILLTPGTSGAFLVAYSLSLSRGEKLALSDPSYPCYKNFASLLGIESVFVNIGKENGYQLNVEELKEIDFNAVLISSPANPTGNIYDSENFKNIIEYCEENGKSFISDELYHGLTYDKKANSALEFSENVFVVNGFSKYYCMPGLRLGWIVVPKKYIRSAEIVSQNLFISAPSLSQYAALEAFDKEHLKRTKDEFKKRRDFLYNELSRFFTIDAKPEGAFYLWADISKYSDDSFDFAKRLLEDIHIASTPGVDFGDNKTKKYIRFAYTRDIDHLSEGIKRLESYL